MAAYEVLLLNTAIPQIQAAQSGDTYVVPRDIAFSTVANLANGTNLLPSLTFSSDTNTGIYREGADALGFTAGGGTNQMVLTTTGLGIGETNPAVRLDVLGQGRVIYNTGATNTGDQSVVTIGATTSGAYSSTYGAGLQFQVTNSGGGYAGGRIVSRLGADNNTANLVFQARNYGYTDSMTLDASGNLLVGGTSNAVGARAILENVSGNQLGLRYTSVATYYNSVDSGGNLIWTKDGSERARITSGGYFKASNSGSYVGATGAYHELVNDFGDYIAQARNSVSSGAFGIRIQYSGSAPNGTGNEFLYCDDNASGGTLRAAIRSNGGLANYSANNVNLASDERLKKDISLLATTWDKLKQIEVVNFRYKDCNEGDPLLYGVIAQQVQPIVPELVVVTREAKEAVEAKDAVLDENGKVIEPAVEAKEATPDYYGIREQPMYWLAIKALQEAMARIEKLEAEVAALKGA